MELSIKNRLWLMVAAAAVALLIVAGTSFHVSGQLASALDSANKNTIPSIGLIDDSELSLLRIRLSATQFIAMEDAERRAATEPKITARLSSLLEKMQKYERELIGSNEERQLFDRVSGDLKTYQAILGRILDLARSGSLDQARQVFANELVKAGDTAYEGLEALAAFNEREATALAEKAESAEKNGNILSLTSSIAALIIVGSLGFWVISSIGKVLGDVRAAVLHIRNNLDFTRRITVRNRDELGETAAALNDLFATMQANLRKISDSTSSVANAAGVLATTSGQVASASQSQSSAASAMAAAVEEMTVSITHVGDRASEANALASDSGKLAESGVSVISRTVEEIGQIAKSVDGASQLIRALDEHTDRISSVVNVITDIADQTNLLALNAAIEAARAGEQGRGFAVVADEVRKLAERTAQSTHEIAQMINTVRTSAQNAVIGMDEAVSKVRSGVERANEANHSIGQIGDSSQRAVGMVSEITDAIREQSTTSTSIAQQVERIAQMAEESSASATESSNAAQELDKAAESMRQILATYRL